MLYLGVVVYLAALHCMEQALKRISDRSQTALIETLIKARKMAKLSQEVLATRLKKPQSYVSKIETGQNRKIGTYEVCDWATACDMEPIVVFSMFTTRLSRRL